MKKVKLNLNLCEVETILIELMNKKIKLVKEKEMDPFGFMKNKEINNIEELIRNMLKQV